MELTQERIDAVVAWVDDLCMEAMRAFQEDGDISLWQRVGRNAATAHYMNNVISIKAIPRELWPAQASNFFKEAMRLYDEYQTRKAEQEKAEAAFQKQATMAEQLETLQAELAKALARVEQLETAAPPKPRKAKRVAEDAPEPDAEADDPPGDEPEEAAKPDDDEKPADDKEPTEADA